MNGKLFDGLNKLIFVYLNGNECIDKNFKDENALSAMPQIVSTKCGFLEVDEDNCSKEKAVIGTKTAEITKHLITIAICQTKLTAAEIQYSSMNVVFDKLDAQHSLTCSAKTKRLRDTVEMKSQEIEELLEEKQRNTVAFREMGDKIKELKRKIDFLV